MYRACGFLFAAGLLNACSENQMVPRHDIRRDFDRGDAVTGDDPDPEVSDDDEDETDPRYGDPPAEDEDPPAEDEDPPSDEPFEGAEWTLMVFVNGDNNLEYYALDDLNEMEMVGSTEDVNVVVQLDRSPGYETMDGDWSGARRYRVERDTDMGHIASPVLADLGWTDSGDPDTVIDFASWAINRYPARRYGLVIWNHGWGWYLREGGGEKGVSDDESTGSGISMADGEYEYLLRRIRERAGQDLELVGMDACIMQSWENAYITAPFAKSYVASQDYESAEGWDYTATLTDLVADPQMTGLELGASIAESFWRTWDSTQSVIDLRQMDDLAMALDGFAEAAIDAGAWSVLERAGGAQEFDGGWGTDHDLGHFMHLAMSHPDARVSAAAAQVRSIYATAVFANYAQDWVPNATGMSIYTPTYGGVDWSYRDGTWADDTRWDDFLITAHGGW